MPRTLLCAQVTNGSSQGDGLPQLAVMLQLYALATRAHAACAALQPQVAPLPGQATVLTGQGRQGLGHFDALDAALGCGMSDDQPPLPTLSSLADAVSPGAHRPPPPLPPQNLLTSLTVPGTGNQLNTLMTLQSDSGICLMAVCRKLVILSTVRVSCAEVQER